MTHIWLMKLLIISDMKNSILIRGLICAMSVAALASCGKTKKAEALYPADFNSMGDAGRIDYIMKQAGPDSLARFIIHTALGHNPGVRIDTLAIATNYAYETLSEAARDTFSVAYDNLVETLPLDEKMKVYMLAGSEDPQGLGYKLGLEYMQSIRVNNKKVEDVDRELEAFKKACGADTAMYRRFMVGFRTVLDVDHGADVPESIYRKYGSGN